MIGVSFDLSRFTVTDTATNTTLYAIMADEEYTHLGRSVIWGSFQDKTQYVIERYPLEMTDVDDEYKALERVYV